MLIIHVLSGTGTGVRVLVLYTPRIYHCSTIILWAQLSFILSKLFSPSLPPIIHCSTGLWVPNIPQFEGVEHTVVRQLTVSICEAYICTCMWVLYSLFPPQGYESVSTNPEDFENKVVLILGRGQCIPTHTCTCITEVHVFGEELSLVVRSVIHTAATKIKSLTNYLWHVCMYDDAVPCSLFMLQCPFVTKLLNLTTKANSINFNIILWPSLCVI